MLNIITFKEKTMLLIQNVLVKGYLIKYLKYYNSIEPYFIVSDKNKTGSFLISNLRPKRKLVEEKYKMNSTNCKILQIAIPEYYQRNFGIFFLEKSILRFNNFLQDDFQEKMIDYILERKTEKKGSIYPAILQFREKYKITEDELAFKTLQKWWERENFKNLA